MSPGAKLAIIVGAGASMILSVRWLLARLFGPAQPSREIHITDVDETRGEHDDRDA